MAFIHFQKLTTSGVVPPAEEKNSASLEENSQGILQVRRGRTRQRN